MLNLHVIRLTFSELKDLAMPGRCAAAVLTLAALLLQGSRSPISAGWLHDTDTAGPSGTAYTPARIADAYRFTPLYRQGINGAGQTVALLEVDGYNPADIQHFDATYGLPAPSIRQYYTDGKPFTTQSADETTADIEWFHALAPGAAIQVYYLDNYESTSQGWSSMGTALRGMIGNGVTVVSDSVIACGPGPGYSATRSALTTLRHAHITTFVSSGDYGAHPGPAALCGRHLGTTYPSSDPSVIAVGGTTLRLRKDNSIADETAWRLSGGGPVSNMIRSWWQVAPHLPAGRNRWVPDVAFLADPRTGVDIYAGGTWSQVGGTSLGAPGWAAAWALISETALRNGTSLAAAPSLLYKLADSTAYHRAFHDILRGGNKHFHAGTGWDAVTGFGTPNVAAMASLLAPPAPGESLASSKISLVP